MQWQQLGRAARDDSEILIAALALAIGKGCMATTIMIQLPYRSEHVNSAEESSVVTTAGHY